MAQKTTKFENAETLVITGDGNNNNITITVDTKEEKKMDKKDNTITKKYLDNNAIMQNTFLYLKKHKITELNFTKGELTDIVTRIVPFSKHKEMNDKEFCNWYLKEAYYPAIAGYVGKYFIKNRYFMAGKRNGELILLVNLNKWPEAPKPEAEPEKPKAKAPRKPRAKKGDK